MGICQYCGQKAGWFSDVHKVCVSFAQQGCEKASLLIAATLEKPVPSDHSDNEQWYSLFGQQLWAEVKPQIDQLATEHRIPADQLRGALRVGWSKGAEQVATAEPMNPKRLSVLDHFYRVMGFTDREMAPTDGFIAEVFSSLLWSVMVQGDPTSVANVTRHPFNLKSGEVPLFFFGSVVYSRETLNRGNQGGYGGMSVRVARGVYYHCGGFKSQRTETAALKEIDYGRMLLTTQNMYFGGEHTNFRVAYSHIVAFRPEPSGISFFRDTANAKAEVFTVLEANPSGGNPVNARPVFGWFLFNMAHALAQPEAKPSTSKREA
jgi:hypothetical protein